MKTRGRVVGSVFLVLTFVWNGFLWGKSVTDRVQGREFPSVFQAWNSVDMPCCFPLTSDDQRLRVTAMHDLLWETQIGLSGSNKGLDLGAVWDNPYAGLGENITKDSRKQALSNRKKILKLNSNMIFLLELRWRDAPAGFLPDNSPYWRRDAEGMRVKGWEGGKHPHYLLDADIAEYQELVAQQASVAVRSGIYDGVMLDWGGHLAIIQAVRKAIGEEGLIIVNIHDEIENAVKFKNYINGSFMELNPLDDHAVTQSNGRQWDTIRESLLYFESNFQRPRINCLEVWGDRLDLQRMRATTTLGLTHSDGYVLYADPNPLQTSDHLHDWYTFWDVPLGKPSSDLIVREDGAYQREFAGGTVIYNHHGNGPVTVEFDDCRKQVSNGLLGCRFTVADTDGDIFVPVR